MSDQKLNVEYVGADTLLLWPGNARRGDVDRLVKSIEEYDLYQPIIVQRSTSRVIIGNHRLMALRKIKGNRCEVPVIFLDYDDLQAGRLNVRDNVENDKSGWDQSALIAQLTSFYEDDLGTLEGSGFTDKELSHMMSAAPLMDGEPVIMTAEQLGEMADKAREERGEEAERREDNTVGGPEKSDGYRLIVICDTELDRDSLLEDLNDEGYDAHKIG